MIGKNDKQKNNAISISMKEKKEAVRQRIAWLVLFFLLLALHFLAEKGLRDDVYFGGVLENCTLPAFLAKRYVEWSSRVLIEAALVWCARASFWVWRLLDTVMLLMLVWIVTDLLGIGKKLQGSLLFFAMLWTVPLVSLSSAGWISTTINYLWPLTLGIVAMRPIKHWLSGEKCPLWEVLLCPVCLLFAANMEQMAAILLGFYLVFGVWLKIEKKKLPLFYFIQLAFIALSLLFILAAPGNALRAATETERFFPEHAALSAAQKLLLGFIETGHYYLAAGYDKSCFVFALLVGVLAVCALRRRKEKKSDWLWMLSALFPLLFYWIIGQLGEWLMHGISLTRVHNAIAVLSLNRQLPGLGNVTPRLVAFQVAGYLLVLVCMLASICCLHGKSRETLLEWLILAAGFASRIMIGFSPTIYASGDRTALFCSVAILIVSWRNLQIYLAAEQKWYWKAGIMIYMGICIAGNLA